MNAEMMKRRLAVLRANVDELLLQLDEPAPSPADVRSMTTVVAHRRPEPKKLGLHPRDLNENERIVLKQITLAAGRGKRLRAADIAPALRKRAKTDERAVSWVRNSLRRLVREEMIERYGDGTYRLARGRR